MYVCVYVCVFSTMCHFNALCVCLICVAGVSMRIIIRYTPTSSPPPHSHSTGNQSM